MLGLLESKLNSLPPEITKNYPDLIHISLNDVNPEIVKITQINNIENNAGINQNKNNNNRDINNKENSENMDKDDVIKEDIVEENRESTPQEKLAKLVEENEDIKSYYNMLKY